MRSLFNESFVGDSCQFGPKDIQLRCLFRESFVGDSCQFGPKDIQLRCLFNESFVGDACQLGLKGIKSLGDEAFYPRDESSSLYGGHLHAGVSADRVVQPSRLTGA